MLGKLSSNKTTIKNKREKQGFIKEVVQNKYLYLLAIPGLIFFFIFHYLPMGGIVIAFQRFNAVKGIIGSKFVGFDNFKVLFNSPDVSTVIFNTLFLNTLFIVFGMAASIIIAVLLNEIGRPIYKRISQSVLILPHFISWTVVAMIAIPLLNSDSGFINLTLESLNLPTINFWQTPDVWPIVLTVLSVWKTAGFDSIIFLATITGISGQIFEAATIDGANRWQQIRYIIIPMLKNTAILLLLLRLGRIFYGNFGLIYPLILDNSFLYPTTDIIDTFVFRALMKLGDMGMASAVGLTQSFLGFILVLVTNTIVKKLNPESAIF